MTRISRYEIQKGDTIRLSYQAGGLKVTKEGTVDRFDAYETPLTVHGSRIEPAMLSSLISYELIERPKPVNPLADKPLGYSFAFDSSERVLIKVKKFDQNTWIKTIKTGDRATHVFVDDERANEMYRTNESKLRRYPENVQVSRRVPLPPHTFSF